jgi:hypothetical protein
VSIGEGKFLEKTTSKPCKWVMWIRDVLTMGAMNAGGCKALLVGAFVEGELHLSWMQFFPAFVDITIVNECIRKLLFSLEFFSFLASQCLGNFLSALTC